MKSAVEGVTSFSDPSTEMHLRSADMPFSRSCFALVMSSAHSACRRSTLPAATTNGGAQSIANMNATSDSYRDWIQGTTRTKEDGKHCLCGGSDAGGTEPYPTTVNNRLTP